MTHPEYDRLEKYGVVLKRLTHDKIELVRQWRNHPKIQKYMEYREEITPEMQEAWFKRINNDNNFYYIIEIDGKEIGLINIRDVDYEKKTGEPGIFIWDDYYLNSIEVYKASLCFQDFYFEKLGIEKTVAHVLKDNKRAIKFNISAGYKLSPGQENVYNQEYTRDYSSYVKFKNKFLKYIENGTK